MAPPSDTSYLTRLRVQLLDDILLSLALISSPALVLSLSRIPVMGWRPVFGLHIGVLALVWGSWIWRRRLPYAFRLGTIMACLGTVGLGGYMQHGPAAVAGHFLILFLMVGAMFLAGRAALLSGAALVVVLGGVGYAATQGWVGFALDYDRYARDPSTWTLLMVATAGYGGAIAMVVARLIDEVDRHERELAAANTELMQRSEDAEAANRLKGEILANLNHEFRTPLNGILGMADLLQMSDDNAERQGWIAELQASARRLDRVLGRMLDFVALGDGNAPLRSGPFDLGELISATVAAFHAQATAKGLHLAYTQDRALPTHVTGDGNRLRQMLGELLTNAIAHTAQGEISCTLHREPAPGGDTRQWVRIALKDTGSGIPPELQERVFAPFVQADNSSTREVGGNGIGLPLCRRIAALMGGTLTLRSTPGQGSCFTLILPFELPGEGR